MRPDASRPDLKGFCNEPFRIFFPLATVFGILGVLLWPAHFWGWLPDYPGVSHTRIMAHSFFGGFILGFLGTAFPRMLSARAFEMQETLPLLILYAAMSVSHLAGFNFLGDALFVVLHGFFLFLLWRRWRERKDLPPPGFILAGLAIGFALAGAVIALLEHRMDIGFFWIALKPLLYYQGFVLLPVLGVGVFFLPRFFGVPSPHNLEESMAPTAIWKREAIIAALAGIGILVSFVMEAWGWFRSSHWLRFGIVFAYLFGELPRLFKGKAPNRWASQIRIAVLFVLAGYAAVGIKPEYRVAFLHATFLGGLAMVVMITAMRVVFGHSGNGAQLAGKNRWFTVLAWLVWLALLTRVSADIWPKIMISHFIYGALVWAVAAAIWAWKVLPKVFIADPED